MGWGMDPGDLWEAGKKSVTGGDMPGSAAWHYQTGKDMYSGAKNGELGIPGFGGLEPEKASTLHPGFDWSGNIQQSRADLQGAIDPVKQWALTGQGPSAAQAQLQAGKDQAIAAAQSQSKSAYGLTPGQQASLATNAGTMATQQAANQSAQLRAAEQQAAMQSYLQAVNAQRQADIDIYKAYSDQYAQTNMANAQSANAFKGGLIEAGAGFLGGLL